MYHTGGPVAKRRERPRKSKRPGGVSSGGGASTPRVKNSKKVQTILQAAIAHHRAGRLPFARAEYESAIKQNAKDPVIFFNLGQCLIAMNEPEAALSHLQKAVALSPRRADFLVACANGLMFATQFESALKMARRAIRIDPSIGTSYFLASYCLEQMDQLMEAIEQVEAGLAILPNDAELGIHRGHLLQRAKRFDDATSQLQAVLNQTSESSSSHALIRQRAIHELGFVHDKVGQYEKAYALFHESGQLSQQSAAATAFDRNRRYDRIRSYQSACTMESLQQYGPSAFVDEPMGAPTFLVGFPRSGTTMTEQILASHPNVTTADEVPILNVAGNEALRMVGGNMPAGPMLDTLSREHICTLRATYWKAVHQHFPNLQSGNVFVDKMPLNIIDLGLINRIFPDARVLVALRDPRDVCLSCFQQDFRLNNSMIHFLSLEHTAAFYNSVMTLYLQLRDQVSASILQVRYEDTVGNLAEQGKRILDHLGLQWSDDLLSFHEKAKSRMISTPSAAAVREPIHGRAIARWKNYKKFIAPITGQLEPFIEAFGYASDNKGVHS